MTELRNFEPRWAWPPPPEFQSEWAEMEPQVILMCGQGWEIPELVVVRILLSKQQVCMEWPRGRNPETQEAAAGSFISSPRIRT